MPLEVGIVGAGIAGLAAAIAQRKAGNHVEIFEASQFKNEIGAAISTTCNGTRILDSWGFDHKKARAVESQICEYPEAKTLKPISSNNLSHLRKEFGHPFYHYHRVDLHNGLREMALDADSGPGPIPELNLGSKVIDIDCENGEITIEDGRKVKKDAIIVADGIWSKFSSVVSGSPKPLKRSVKSAFRTLIPFEEIYKDKELKEIFSNRPLGFWAPRAKMTTVVTYPCRDATLLNVAVLHDTLPGQEDAVDWHSRATIEEVLSVTGDDFNPIVTRLLKMSSDYMVFKIMSRDLMETLVRGRVAIIGDAAHWMFPTHAQGAVVGLEEATSLGMLLEGVDPSEVPQRLKLHNELHIDRVHVIQLLSNYGSRELAQKKSKKPIPPADAPLFSAPVFDYFYTYDVAKETRKLMAERLVQNGVS